MIMPRATNSRKDGIVTAIGVLVLLLGTATGNAIAMLVMSIVGLAVITIFYRQSFGRIALLVMLVGACTAAAVAVLIAAF
jgi:hypothetical protein